MFQLTFLGTAASAPSARRGLPALLVRHEGQSYLVDCGEGTQRQIIRSPLGFGGLETVLLTHAHPDHILGVCGLVATLALWRAVPRLSIFGGAESIRAAQSLVQIGWPRGRPALDLALRAISGGPVIESPKLRITAFPVRHSAPDSFGFRFEEPVRRHLSSERLSALGVPDGAERGMLAAGKPVTLEDGRIISPREVEAAIRPGAKLAVVGDTESVQDLIPHVEGADLLVIESTFLHDDVAKARARSHLTARQAAELAAAAGAGTLFLTHISDRYAPKSIAAEARAVFPETYIAEDFEQVLVRQGAAVPTGNAAIPETLRS